MRDPFYTKKKRRKKFELLHADAWLDSSIYELFQSLGRGYTRYREAMSIFHVTGVRRFVTEILSDTASFGAIGAVLMLGLAIPAFDETVSGEFNKAEDYSVIFLDRYGSEIGRRGIRSDDSIPLDKLPDNLIKATLATEDQHFYTHFGIDPVGTMRALISNAQGDSGLQGGSSITQQLAKNLFLTPERTLERKIKEAFLSIWLETHYTKDEILKLYFDRAYMGGGNFGVVAAAEYYFGKQVQDITLAESAMLAGLFKAPTRFAPHVDLAAARGRANVVLTRMVDSGFLSEGQVTAARRAPATHIDREDEINSPNYFLDWAFEETKKLIAGRSDIGFVVRTTIDPDLQSYAEEAATSIIRESGQRYGVQQAAMVVAEPGGAVRAMVGGMDYGVSQYNRATAPTRQPGSSFKLFVYATAFEQESYSPKTVVSGGSICIGNWCPRNYSGGSYGSMSLMNAFTRSINTVPVRLSVRTGRQPIADMARRLGIQNDFPVTRSLALGPASVSVLDMTSSYGVFANGGLKSKSNGISRISTLRGDVIYEFNPDENSERIVSEEVAAGMNRMMRNVVANGTARRAQVDGVPASGKTGTTSSYRDAWFCGFTGNYVAAVWMGNDDYRPTRRLTGGSLPAMIWQKFMEFAHSNIEVKPVFGVDFEPRPFLIAEAAEGENLDAAASLRPPTLQPEAAQKLVDVSQRLRDALERTDVSVQFSAGLANSPKESL